MMLGKLRSESNRYPIFAFVSAWLMLLAGLLIVKESYFLYYLAALVVLELAFSYARTLLLILPTFALLGLLTALLSLAFATAEQAVFIAFRLILLGVSVVPTISMLPIDLVRCLNQKNCPRIIALGLLIALRFVPIMFEENRRIRRAMTLKGANTAWYRPAIWYRAMLLPLIMRLLSISDTMASSMETRAFVLNEKSSHYKIIKTSVKDWVYLILVLLLSVGAVLWRFYA